MDIYITTRSRGFIYHGYPYDYWRYEINDMIKIFKDFEIIRLESDWEAPGVFLKARKPINWRPIDLNDIALYSIVFGRRIKDPSLSRASLSRKLILKICTTRIKWLLPGTILNMLIKKYCT